jgi:hypothetical protein
VTTDPMPVFTIKAKDKLALRAVDAYRILCEGLGLDEQAREVERAYTEIDEWRQRNPGEIKLPDHKHVPAADHHARLAAGTEDSAGVCAAERHGAGNICETHGCVYPGDNPGISCRSQP